MHLCNRSREKRLRRRAFTCRLNLYAHCFWPFCAVLAATTLSRTVKAVFASLVPTASSAPWTLRSSTTFMKTAGKPRINVELHQRFLDLIDGQARFQPPEQVFFSFSKSSLAVWAETSTMLCCFASKVSCIVPASLLSGVAQRKQSNAIPNTIFFLHICTPLQQCVLLSSGVLSEPEEW